MSHGDKPDNRSANRPFADVLRRACARGLLPNSQENRAARPADAGKRTG